jgi:ABC-type dipeptide/oligopeptide/nickel transport system permease component
MLRYCVRRVVLVVPVVWAVMTLLFLAFFVVPGDTVEAMAGDRAVTPAVRENIEAKLGLDRPWYVQYGRYWKRIATGDLGQSYQSFRSVNDVVKESSPASLRLAFWALAIQAVVGIGVGVVAAVKRSSILDALATLSTAMLVALPAFVLGYLLQLLLGVYAFEKDLPGWARFPVQGIGADTWSLGVLPTGGQWRHLLLPAVTLAATSTAVVARMTRTTMAEVLGADYVRTAVAKGLRRRQVTGHALKNAAVPVMTFIGVNLGGLIGSAILTETVFNWPGIGSEIAAAVHARDAPVVLGLSLVVVLAYLLVNLALDVGHAWLDPRIRSTGGDR